MAGPIPNPANRTATKPIYIVVAVDPTVESGYQKYLVEKLDEFTTHIEIKGYLITKAQATKLRESPSAKNDLETEINRKIPWVNVARIENITFRRKAQKEVKNDY